MRPITSTLQHDAVPLQGATESIPRSMILLLATTGGLVH